MTPVPCPGCGSQPVNSGGFGRHKLVCPKYQARDPDTDCACFGHPHVNTWTLYCDAVWNWNQTANSRRKT